MRFHELAIFIFGEVAAAVFIGHRHKFAAGTADADGENLDALFGRRLRCRDAFTAEVFAIGDEHENFFRCGARLEHGLGFTDRRRHVSAAERDRGGVEGVERLAEGVVVERHRALQEGVASKGHQTHAVAFEFGDEILHAKLCASQAVRLHVLRQHAFGSVHGKEQLQPLAVRFLPFKTRLRPCQCDEQQPDAEREQHALGAPPRCGDRACEFVQQTRRRELRERGTLREIKPAILPEEGSAGDDACKQPERLGKVHKSKR